MNDLMELDRGGMAAAVLSGGRSSRMGWRNKALLPFEGRPLIARTLELLTRVFGGVAIVSGDGAAYADLGAPVIPDVVKNKGPLGGIHAALAAGGGRPVFVAACDMPFLDEELVRALAGEWLRRGSGVVVPRAGFRSQPLCGVYGPELAEPLREFLWASADLSVGCFLRAAGARFLELDPGEETSRAFANLNSPRELAAARG